MSLITYGPIVSNARKKIAGVVATKAHSGNFIRTKVAPTQPRTTTQRGIRASLSALAKNWAALTAVEISAWNAFAKNVTRKNSLGESYTPTGFQLYVGLNINLQTVSGSPESTPPATLVASSPGALTVAATAPSTTLTVTPTNYPAVGEAAAVSAASPISAGRSFVGKQYRFIMAVPYSATPTAYNIKTNYTAKFGNWTVGKKIAVLVKNINITTGAAGIPTTGIVISS